MRAKRSRPSTGLLLAATLLWGGACDSKGDQEASGPTYSAHCRVALESSGEAPRITAAGRGPNAELAEQAAWSQLCQDLALPAGCGDSLPDGLRSSGVMCIGLSNFEGTGLALADPNTHNCTVTLTDRRGIVRAENEVTREGSREELEGYSEELCAAAIAAACAELGAEGDCTAGEAPAFRIVEQSAGRQLVRRSRQ